MRIILIFLLLCFVFCAGTLNANTSDNVSPYFENASAIFDFDSFLKRSDTLLVTPGSEHPVEFFIGISIGYGFAGTVCDDCGESGQQNGSTFQGKLGLSIHRRIELGLETGIWINGWGAWKENTRKIYRNHFLVMLYYYPVEQINLYTKFGLGLSSYTAYDRCQNIPYCYGVPTEIHGEGLGFAAGLGYEIRLSRQVSIGPHLTYFHGELGDLVLNHRWTIATNRNLNLIDIQFGTTWRVH